MKFSTERLGGARWVIGVAIAGTVASSCHRPSSQSRNKALQPDGASTAVATEPSPPTSDSLSMPAPPPVPSDVAAPSGEAIKTSSGIAMKVLRAGRGADHPKGDDCVKITFEGWSRDGVLRASSPSGADAMVQCLRQIVPGLAEALMAMSVGEERRVWIPADLAFSSDDHDRTTPKVDMTYDIALLDLMKAPPVPKDLKAPRNATKTPSGLAFQILKRGQGTEHPTEMSRVLLNFSGWKADGTLVETTLMTGRPASYTVGDVIAGWREALLRSVVGEKVRVWIPAALAYGEKPPRKSIPGGDLIYEFEVVAIE